MELAASRIPAHVEPATASLFIVSPLSGGRGLLSLFSTHPRMEERIRRLRGLMVSLDSSQAADCSLVSPATVAGRAILRKSTLDRG